METTVTDEILNNFLSNFADDDKAVKVVDLMNKVLGSKETIVRLLRILIYTDSFNGANPIKPLTICGKCGEFVPNGYCCPDLDCHADPVYTSKEMIHGLLSLTSRKKII